MMEQTIFGLLSTGATLAGARVYSDGLPLNPVFPAIVFSRVATDVQRSLNGESGLDLVRFQIDCWATKVEDSITLGGQVRVLMQTIGAQTVSVLGGREVAGREIRYRRILDFHVWEDVS